MKKACAASLQGMLVGMAGLVACTSAGPSAIPAPGPSTMVMASELEVPWSLAFLPDESIIFTERPGRVRYMDPEGRLLEEPLLVFDDVAAEGEAGLLGVAVHPDFSSNGYTYFYYTYRLGGVLLNRVVRYSKRGMALMNRHIVLEGIPAGSIHDGGRLKFGPDQMLYVTTGETGNPQLAQDLSSLAGKILRVNEEGTVPRDNPFPGSPIFSYGHRNPEGLAWDSRGRLWATEHGSSATDEVNMVQAGKNYGWPAIRGDLTAPGMEKPVIQSGSETWAPSGAAFLGDSLFFTGLRGETLFDLDTRAAVPSLRKLLSGQFGRLRDVVVGPDGMLYILTSNRDGRGSPRSEDDRLIRVDPNRL